MFDALHRSSAFLFYAIGSVTLLLLLLVRMKVAVFLSPVLNSLDLPVIFVAILYGGLSLYKSIAKPDRRSTTAAVVIAVPLIVLFGLLAYLNFAFPVSTGL